jgi:SAM-dependent methyltransferase
MTDERQRRFWNRFARRYAARPIKDIAAYEALLVDAASRLQPTDRVLEIGCGTGGTAIRPAGGVRSWTATDFSCEMIGIARGKPGPGNLHFVVTAADDDLDGGPFDAVCAFNVLHLVKDIRATLPHLHCQLKPGGLLISKTWCFADLPLALRALFAGLRTFGLFPTAASLTGEQLRCAIRETGFAIEDERVFGSRLQNAYIVARRT